MTFAATPSPEVALASTRAEPPVAWSTRLSDEQLRFYFLHQMNPADPDIYICRTLRLTGELDLERLRRAVRELAKRHDILRCYVPTVDGQVRLSLHDSVESALHFVDLTEQPEPARDAELTRLLAEHAHVLTPLHIDSDVLFRVTVIKRSDVAHVLLCRFHHIILDGTSVRLFLQGLLEAYGSDNQALAPRPMKQFRDFLQWEQERATEQARRANQEFWARKLANPAVLDLTFGKLRPERHTREAGTIHLAASPALQTAIARFCRAHHVTPYTVMMASLKALLFRVTGERDVLVATPMAYRQRREFLPMLGVLLNWIACRTQVDAATTFSQLIASVRAEVPEAYARQCSYEALLHAAGTLRRDPSRSPLFQVTLNFAKYDPLPQTERWTVELDPISHQQTHYDLSVRFEEVGDLLTLGLTYYRGAMDAATAELLAGALLGLAERCLAEPEQPIGALALPPLAALPRVPTPPPRRQLVITSTFTAEPTQPALEVWLDRLGLRYDLAFTPLDQVFQELIDPSSQTSRNHLGVNLVLLRLEDWTQPASAVAELAQLIAGHAARNPAPMLLVVCPPPADRRVGAALEQHRELSAQLVAAAASIASVHVLTWAEVVSQYPVELLDDAESDAYAKAPYSEDFTIALASAVARKLNAMLRPPPKVLVLDCDNTLWRGVIGEDGVEGVEVDAGRRRLQELAVEQLHAGVLVCLASKNNEQDVWEAFERVPGMVLRRDMIVAHRINWAPKSDNLKSLARELNLGIDSFVFLDDSPAECAEVRAACPSVITFRVPTATADILHFLKHLWPLDARKLTDTDRKRSELYFSNARREQLRASTADLGAFIASLQVQTRFLALSSDNLARASQMTQRTNQFNTTTVRRSEAELAQLAEAGTEVLLVDVSDRFGDYGLVGLASYRAHGQALLVDALLLSCRALGRGVEQTLLAELGRVAAERGLEVVELPYRRTAKNRPAALFLDKHAAAFRVPGASEDEARYLLPVQRALDAVRQVVSEQAAEVPQEGEPAAAPPDPAAAASQALWQDALRLDSVAAIRAELRATLQRSRSTAGAVVAPRNELEASMCRIWCDVLLLDEVSIHDDYFALGGDSIRSLALVAQLRRAQLPVTVLDVHEHSTIAKLAALLQTRDAPVHVAPIPTLPTAGAYPASFSQSYVIEIYARENLVVDGDPSGAFHIQDRLTVREKRSGHSFDALARAVAHVVRRTPQLRMSIFQRDGRWFQTELSPDVEVFTALDLTALEGPAQRARIDELMLSDRRRPFAPERGLEAPVRIYGIATSESTFELVVTAHHAFCDGWSLQACYNHLFALYQAYKQGDEPAVAQLDDTLATHEHSFRELVQREQENLASPALDRFWSTYFPSRFHMPVRSAAPRRDQQRLNERRDWELVTAAHERALASQTSLKAVLLDAFAAALAARLPMRGPLVLAVITNGRKDDLTSPMEVFGLCWTIVPIVVDVAAARGERLATLHRDLITTEAHARFPVAKMFQGFEPADVVRASFNLTNFHNSSWRAGTSQLDIAKADSFHRFHFPVDFNFHIDRHAQQVALKMNWSRDAFDRSLAHDFLDTFAAELSPSGRSRRAKGE
jgi:FkbH-like protein